MDNENGIYHDGELVTGFGGIVAFEVWKNVIEVANWPWKRYEALPGKEWIVVADVDHWDALKTDGTIYDIKVFGFPQWARHDDGPPCMDVFERHCDHRRGDPCVFLSDEVYCDNRKVFEDHRYMSYPRHCVYILAPPDKVPGCHFIWGIEGNARIMLSDCDYTPGHVGSRLAMVGAGDLKVTTIKI
jgi:hypothetical protein